MRINDLEVYLKEGEILPPWYYGFAYREWFANREVWLPIPINLLARWHRYGMMRWNAWRGKDDSVTARLRRMARAQDHLAYERGRDYGYESAVRRLKTLYGGGANA